MGFNNVGVAQFLNNLYQWEPTCPVGINIGKNQDTPIEHAVDDYVSALRAVYPHADYVTINISSPNTAGLRELQNQENFDELCARSRPNRPRSPKRTTTTCRSR